MFEHYACAVCGKRISRAHTGPAPVYCGASHKQAAYMARQEAKKQEYVARLEATNAKLRQMLKVLHKVGPYHPSPCETCALINTEAFDWANATNPPYPKGESSD